MKKNFVRLLKHRLKPYLHHFMNLGRPQIPQALLRQVAIMR